MVKGLHFLKVFFVLSIGLLTTLPTAGAEEVQQASQPTSEAPMLLMSDFNSGDKPNNVGGDFGSWNYAPTDETQGCWDAFEPIDYTGKEGYAVAIDYDVKSPNPAFCGFWMKLGGSDVTTYDTLSLWLKGDEKAGATSRFKVELRNKQGGRAVFTVSGIDNTWQEFNIPIKRTRSIKDWSKMEELTIVFDDILATKKVGKIFLDQIAFKKLGTEEGTSPQEQAPPSQSV